jgi:hypothetical protein
MLAVTSVLSKSVLCLVAAECSANPSRWFSSPVHSNFNIFCQISCGLNKGTMYLCAIT